MKWSNLLWLGIVLVCSFGVYVLVSANSGSVPHDIVSSVPLGIHISELDPYLIRGKSGEGRVTEWTEKTTEPFTDFGDVTENRFGRFKKRDLGNYDIWKQTIDKQSLFSGEIRFYDYGTTSSDVNAFFFMDGVLIDKDWGFLPR